LFFCCSHPNPQEIRSKNQNKINKEPKKRKKRVALQDKELSTIPKALLVNYSRNMLRKPKNKTKKRRKNPKKEIYKRKKEIV
jgi:hypothetical protein